MTTSDDRRKNSVLIESLRQTVEELEERMGYKAKELMPEEQDQLDTLFHNAKRMRRFIEPTDS